MDTITAPGGFLGGFFLAGILLPISASFIVDGIVLYFRGRTPVRLVTAASLTLVIIVLYGIAWQNALYVNEGQQLSGAIGLILWFSIPAAALGFAVRMLALFLNPSTRALDQEAIAQRASRRSARVAARVETRRNATTRHA
jgi:hypothetical protein